MTTETIKGDRARKMLGPDLARAVLAYAMDWVTQPVLSSQFSVQPGDLGWDWQISFLVRVLLLAHRWLSLCCPLSKVTEELSGVSFYRDANSSARKGSTLITFSKSISCCSHTGD